MTDIAAVDVRRAALREQMPAWPSHTLAEAFDSAADRHPDRALFTDELGSHSYSDIQAWSRRLAHGLIANGVHPGDHVALLMANYAEFVAVKLAIARAGCVAVPVNFNLRGEELRYVLDQSDATVLVTMDSFRGHDHVADLDRFAPHWRTGGDPAVPKLRKVFVFATSGVQPLGAATLDDLGQEGERARTGGAQLPASGDPLGPCDILYTSGTTGRSKGVILTHDMVLRAAYASTYHRALGDGRSAAHALPMYHVFGYVECLVVAWFVGGGVVTQAAFDPASLLKMAEEHRVTDIIALPNQTIKLLEAARADGFDPSHLVQVFNSGGINPPGIWDEIRAVFKPREMITGYGMSECTASSVCTLPDGDDAQLATNGCYKLADVAGDPAIRDYTAIYRVVDPETGAELPAGEIGELLVRGPIVTPGYYKKPEETAQTFTTDGWLRSGDLGRVSADGYLTLTGRLKESYRCGGEMVMPREIEAIIETHPLVELALAIGIPDVQMGEVGCLCIVPRADARPDADALLALCAERLARFKVPRHVLFFELAEIPVTVTGRPQKLLLVPIARERLAEKPAQTAPAQ